MSDSPLPDTDDGRFDHVRIRPRIRYQPQDGNGNGEKALLKWILGVVSTLFVSAVIGYWTQTIQFAEMRTEVRNLKEQFAEFKRLVEPRYRGRPAQE
jgi:hypothetical protein